VLTKNQQNGGEEVSVVQFDLDDLAENPGVLELLTKESIRSGKSDEIAEQVAQTNRAIRHLQENEDSVTEAAADAVESEVGELTIDLGEQAREFVQNLVSVLREQRQFVSEAPPADSDTSPRDSNTDPQETGSETQGYVIQFSDGKRIPERGAEIHTKQNQNMGAAVDYLIAEYDLLSVVDVPYVTPRARTKCTINSEPTHPNGDDMRLPYELVDDSYLETALNTRSKQSRLRRLAEHVGLSVEFSGEW